MPPPSCLPRRVRRGQPSAAGSLRGMHLSSLVLGQHSRGAPYQEALKWTRPAGDRGHFAPCGTREHPRGVQASASSPAAPATRRNARRALADVSYGQCCSRCWPCSSRCRTGDMMPSSSFSRLISGITFAGSAVIALPARMLWHPELPDKSDPRAIPLGRWGDSSSRRTACGHILVLS